MYTIFLKQAYFQHQYNFFGRIIIADEFYLQMTLIIIFPFNTHLLITKQVKVSRKLRWECQSSLSIGLVKTLYDIIITGAMLVILYSSS